MLFTALGTSSANEPAYFAILAVVGSAMACPAHSPVVQLHTSLKLLEHIRNNMAVLDGAELKVHIRDGRF